VSIKLLISDWQADRDDRMQALADLAGVPGIEVRLSYVAEWSGGYIPFARVDHCKFVVVDGVSTWIGTSNWGPGYFETSRNIAVTIRNRSIAGKVQGLFEVGWTDASAIPVTRDGVYPRRIHGEEPPPGSVLYGG
jgi:phosphatidylserine/phosphatidylglycerophosphate/cardiolipin synthase-like enzyme